MTGYITPDAHQFRLIMQAPWRGPLILLNLVRLRRQAAYGDGRIATGAEAWDDYLRLLAPLLHRAGGRVLWAAPACEVLIGPEDEEWDLGVLVEYPDAATFRRLITSPDYRPVSRHREAAVRDSRLIRFGIPPQPSSDRRSSAD